MPSFDVVSEVDLHELANAVDQANRELRTRFDFRNIDAGFSLSDDGVLVWAQEEFQLEQLNHILRTKLAGRKLDVKSLLPGTIESSGKRKQLMYDIQQGLTADISRQIVQTVKKSNKKLQSQIQGSQVRVSGKKRDDLQQVIAILRELDITLPLQFRNFRD